MSIPGAFPEAAPPAAVVPTKTGEEQKTPERDVARYPKITVAQRQALIDNLQLEVTERARKLRAIYALHAQGLRSRLEMRINRVPQSLRSANIEELVNKYANPSPVKPAPLGERSITNHEMPRLDSTTARADKENSPLRSLGKKRPR
ncbi:hypothetical protein P152DRAFT_483769 [Eremomyces bilateralis CBS 781.70]|uniref:Borealin N-terminal domain-containing protein n=1 Tax=Eremomyces bilateralis CBS 781.70 TaxID=1392243 RepID=A0A6G1FY45_9PEZI|nr:uncharacterized protein P152DRAFT_483769 [Eremomyces bilateralis CBS 781.70]KAF1810694.1 hypothetical protein P152DRAFT_483769 [Eremomyces bilateralis CBS 781.70]